MSKELLFNPQFSRRAFLQGIGVGAAGALSSSELIMPYNITPDVLQAQERKEVPEYQAGVSFLAYGYDGMDSISGREYFKEKTGYILDRLAAMNVNSISLVTPLFMESINASTVTKDPVQTPSREIEKIFFDEAKSRDFFTVHRRVLHEGNFDTANGEWRGTLYPVDPNNPSDPVTGLNTWFQNYSELVVEDAKFSEEQGVDVVTIGVEFTNLEQYTQQWTNLIEAVRSYDVLVRYDTNWDTYRYGVLNFDVARKLDILGYDFFNKFELPPVPTVQEYYDALQPAFIELDEIKSVINSTKAEGETPTRLVLGEQGMKSQENAAQAPYVSSDSGFPANEDVQANFFAASCGIADGTYIWNVDINSLEQHVEDAISYNFLDKKAESVIADCFDEVT